MKVSKHSHFARLLADVKEKHNEEILSALPDSLEKYTFRNTHVFSGVPQFENEFENRVGKVVEIIDDLNAMIYVSNEVFEKLPQSKKLKLQAMQGKFNEIRTLIFELDDCNSLIKLDYEEKIRNAFHSLLKAF